MRKDFRLLGLIAVFVTLWISAAFAEEVCRVPIRTTEGPVIGMEVEGLEVCAYKGIPYAAPPVGKRRWRSPERAPQRSEVFEATDFGPECSQVGMGVPFFAKGGYKPEQSEDCLHINIWRTKKSKLLPVMVWIHGGGLTAGSGSEPMYNGDKLAAQKGVLVVSFNYRLAAFGFLAHRDLSKENPRGSSGNYGLLDQIAALAWIRENIIAFGGDPNNVTIFGESAGGWSVCNLLASPLARGLFNQAIIQSGGCDTTLTMEKGFADGDEFAEQLGCSAEEVLSCMRSKPADKIVKIVGNRWEDMDNIGLKHLDNVWAPHEDGWVLNETPIKALKSGRYNKVPLMVGTNRFEGKLFALNTSYFYRMTRKSKVKKALRKSLGETLLPLFEKLYPYRKYSRSIEALIDAKGDLVLGCKCFDAAEASADHRPTYYYRFDYDDHRLSNLLDAAHGLEIPFIFDGLDRPYVKSLYSGGQRKRARPLVNAMMSYWTNFAVNADPNGPNLLKWPVYDRAERKRMILDLPQRVEQTDIVEKCEFWKTHGPNIK